MIGIKRILTTIFALTIAKISNVKYDIDAKIYDVRKGVSLTVTYPPNLVDTLAGGELKASLGNFGHI